MASTAALNITGTVTGLPTGSETVNIALTNTTAVGSHIYTTLTSAGSSNTAVSFNAPPDARFCIIVPPSTNTQPIRFGDSTVSPGWLLSSGYASLFSIGSTASTFWLWSTGTNAVNGVQVSFY